MTNAANEAAAEALHQHGSTRSDADAGRHGQTPRWQDCSHAETHRGAGRDVARAVLDAVGYDALVERCEIAERNLRSEREHSEFVTALHERACRERDAARAALDGDS